MKSTYATNLLPFPLSGPSSSLANGSESAFTVALIKSEEQSAFDKKIL